jgi:hypothetical protein
VAEEVGLGAPLFSASSIRGSHCVSIFDHMGVVDWSKKNAAALITALGGESVKALVEYCKESAGEVASKAIAGGVIGAAAGPLGMIGGVAAGMAASIGANLISDGLVRDREKPT